MYEVTSSHEARETYFRLFLDHWALEPLPSDEDTEAYLDNFMRKEMC